MIEQKSKIADWIVISEREKKSEEPKRFPWNHILMCACVCMCMCVCIYIIYIHIYIYIYIYYIYMYINILIILINYNYYTYYYINILDMLCIMYIYAAAWHLNDVMKATH